MKETFADLKKVYPEMPAACDQAFMRTIYSVQEKQRVGGVFHPARRIAILVALMLALTCAAGAAFYPQIISWFSNRYGQEWGSWMEDGNIALPDASVEVNGAVFTVDEVLVRGRGLYILGHIKAEPGHIVIEQECSITDPFGYSVHHGGIAPEGTPTIAERAAEDGSSLHFVSCDLVGIGINGGTILQTNNWGYSVKTQTDGSIMFSMEIEDGIVVEPGKEYTLVLQAKTYGLHQDGSLNYADLTEKTLSVTTVPEIILQTDSEDVTNSVTADVGVDSVITDAAPTTEPTIVVPDEYTRTGTLPVYCAVDRNLIPVVAPEWINASGIKERTEFTGKNGYKSVNVVFNNEAVLSWDAMSLNYNAYIGTEEIIGELEFGEKVSTVSPKPTLANAASGLARWMLVGWPGTDVIYVLENESLTNISLEEAKRHTDELLASLGLEGYVCYDAIDMSLGRIQEMGARWNMLIAEGRFPDNPQYDYSQATTDDEGYYLRYYRNGNDSALGGMFHADVYVTATGFAYINICDMYANGTVYSTPASLIDYSTVVDALPAELATARHPLTLENIVSVRLTWCPVRSDSSGDGMLLTPVWVINFNASGDEQGATGRYAIFDAIDGHLIDGNWM